MILDAILTLLSTFLAVPINGLLDLLPPPPDWLVTASSIAGDAIDLVYEFDTYLPISFTLTAVSFVLAGYVFMMAAEITRMVLSFITLGGGAK